MDSERQLVIEYAAEQDAFGVSAAFDEGLVETAPDARDWLERAMPRVEREIDHRRRFWVALSDIYGLGQQGIDTAGYNFVRIFGTTGCRNSSWNYSRQYDDLAPEVVEAAEQFDGTVPDAPGDRAADCADDPLVVDTSDLRPFSDLFEN